MSVQTPLPSTGIQEIVISSVFLFFAIIAVVARFWARAVQRKSIWVDDYLIVASLIFTIATVVVGYALVINGGVGLHMADASEEQVAITLKLFVPAPLLWAISTSLLKFSILFFYVSIFTMPKIRTAVFVIIGLTAALIVVVIFESFLLCRPFEFTWNKTIAGGVCGSSKDAYLAIGITNLIIDLCVVAVPMPVVWKLQMPTRKKVVVSAILGFGVLICGLTAARIHSIILLDSADFTYSVVEDLVFGALEIELGIVNACLPVLGPLTTKVFGQKSGFFKGWSNKSELNSGIQKSSRTARFVNNKDFERLSDYTFPLQEAAPGLPSNETIARANSSYSGHRETGEVPFRGDIMVQKDFYVYHSPA
ncbi:hypothetical protein F5Y17DRAFT_448888 [Xylariaceae sp. FL0594]|nr:hypothetical protein F5Y17DRAFT_448888 [Xylariaceae sp. FL0594]